MSNLKQAIENYVGYGNNMKCGKEFISTYLENKGTPALCIEGVFQFVSYLQSSEDCINDVINIATSNIEEFTPCLVNPCNCKLVMQCSNLLG